MSVLVLNIDFLQPWDVGTGGTPHSHPILPSRVNVKQLNSRELQVLPNQATPATAGQVGKSMKK